MPRYIAQRPFREGLDIQIANRAAALRGGVTEQNAEEGVTSAHSCVTEVLLAPRRARRATMPGPSRRITVEPLTVPLPSPSIPAPVPPEVEPTEEPRPGRDPVPTP